MSPGIVWALESSLDFPWPGVFRVCEAHGIQSACFLHPANLTLDMLPKQCEYGRGWFLAQAHGEAVSEVPGELLFSFLSGSKSAESLSELCLLISLMSTKLFPFLLLHLTLNTQYAAVLLIRPTG